MHSHSGRLYGTTNRGHMLYFVFFSKNGLKPSVARRNLRFLASFAKFRNSLLKSCHTTPTVGWLVSFSIDCRFTLCHCADYDASLVANILFTLGANKKCHKTFCGIFFLSGFSILTDHKWGNHQVWHIAS
jgi:hypothetical protein